MFRSFGALIGDLLAVVLFVAVGLIQHGAMLTAGNVFVVGWPFVAGALLGHLAVRSWHGPFRLWPHGTFVWAITVVAAMAIRTLFAAGTEASFVIVTALVLAVLMLGWRAAALYLTRGERVQVIEEREWRAGRGGGAADGNAPGPGRDAPGADEDAPGADEDAPGADEDAPGADEDAPGADEDAPGADEDAADARAGAVDADAADARDSAENDAPRTDSSSNS